jgi:hypothetical protein
LCRLEVEEVDDDREAFLNAETSSTTESRVDGTTLE